MLDRLVAEEAFDGIDADGGVELVAIAGIFAGMVADAPHAGRQRIVLGQSAPGIFIIAGFRVGVTGAENKELPAVAISHGDDLMTWDVVPIHAPASKDLWGESTVFVNGAHIVNIARYGAEARALMAVSAD